MAFSVWIKLNAYPPPSTGSVIMYADNLFSFTIITGNKYQISVSYLGGNTMAISSPATFTFLTWQQILIGIGLNSINSYFIFNSQISYPSSVVTPLPLGFMISLDTAQIFLGHSTLSANFYLSHLKLWSNYKSPDELSLEQYRTFSADLLSDPYLALYLPLDESEGNTFYDMAGLKSYTFASIVDTWEEDNGGGRVVNAESISLATLTTPSSSNKVYTRLPKPVFSLFGDSARSFNIISDIGSPISLYKEFTIELWCKIVATNGLPVSGDVIKLMQTDTSAFSLSATITAAPDLVFTFAFSDSTNALIQSISSLNSVPINSWVYLALSKFRLRNPILQDQFMLYVTSSNNYIPSTNIKIINNPTSDYAMPNFAQISLKNIINYNVFMKEVRVLNLGKVDFQWRSFQ